MDFLEKDLEDIIYNTDNKNLYQRGLLIEGFKRRQVSIGNYGIADLITLSKPVFWEGGYPEGETIDITIYELKNQVIDASAFWQALRYWRGVTSHLRDIRKGNYKARIALIGRKINRDSDFCYLPDFFEGKIKIYEYSYDYDGIYFEEISGIKLNNEGF